MNIFFNRYFQISLIIFFLYISPWFILGQDSYILIHDNLDSNIIFYKVISGVFFSSSSQIMSYMNATTNAMDTIYILSWINYLFDSYTAYIINQILIRLTAFIGMYLLLKKYILNNKKNKEYAILLALLYSLLPFWPFSALSVAGLPLITYVFLNIRQGYSKRSDWIILILFPFYSSFVTTMIFYIVFVGIVWIYDIGKKQIKRDFTIALFIFGILYLFTNYRLFEIFIFGDNYISHRVEFTSHGYSILSVLKKIYYHFLFGQYHAPSIHILFLPFICIIFIVNIFSKSKDKLLIGLFILNILISIWYAFWDYSGLSSLKESISIFKSFNFSRFHWLTPLIWYVLFALSIKYYLDHFNNFKYKKLLLNILIVMTVLHLFYKSDFVNEYRSHKISYRQFYAQNLFHNIDKFINKDKSTYKVVSIGIHPAIAAYSGFYTLDGYVNTYPLKYKHEFRKIIEKELSKNQYLKNYFDKWGSRCYVFIDAVGGIYLRKKDEVYPIRIDLNTDELKKMGGEYIFSSYQIINTEKNNIKLLKKFEDNDSAWDIYLYHVE